MALSKDQQALKDKYITQVGAWTPGWEAVLEADPRYFSAYLNLCTVPVKNRHLPQKTQELVLLACDVQCTHLFVPGIRAHIESALKAGATKAELIEVMELSSALGIHSVTAGVPALLEVLEEEGKITKEDMARPLDARQEKLKENFRKKRGYYGSTWDPVLLLYPDFFEAYTEISSVPFLEPALDSKTKEFIYCAIDVATSHLYIPGLKVHMRNALRYGATAEELMEVMELATQMGTHSVLVGAEILKEFPG